MTTCIDNDAFLNILHLAYIHILLAVKYMVAMIGPIIEPSILIVKHIKSRQLRTTRQKRKKKRSGVYLKGENKNHIPSYSVKREKKKREEKSLSSSPPPLLPGVFDLPDLSPSPD